MLEQELAVGAGRAEAGIAAGGRDFRTRLEHGDRLLLAEELLGLVGGEGRQEIVDALDALVQCGEEDSTRRWGSQRIQKKSKDGHEISSRGTARYCDSVEKKGIEPSTCAEAAPNCSAQVRYVPKTS
jgi:hypothetical protein